MLAQRFFQRLTKSLVFSLLFLLPIFFLPVSLDVLELNKQTLLVILSFAAAISWMAGMIQSKTFAFKRGFLNLVPLLLLASVAISALFSIGPYVSFLGASSQHYMSVLTILGLTVLFYVLVNTISSKEDYKKIHLIFLSSSVLVAIIGMCSLFGFPIFPFSFATLASFNPIGTLNAFGMYLSVMTVFACSLFISHQENSTVLHAGIPGTIERVLIVVLSVSTLLVLITLDFWMLWVVFVLGLGALVALVLFRPKDFDQGPRFFLPLLLLALGLLFLFWVPSLIRLDVPVEVTPSHASSWSIATQTLSETSALFGSGPGTYAFDYAQFHSDQINQSAFWNTRFDRANSFALTVLTSLGVFGAFFWLLFALSTLGASMRIIAKNPRREVWLHAAIHLPAFLSLFAAALLYSSNMTLTFLFFVFAGLIGSQTLSRKVAEPAERSPRWELIMTFGFVLAVFVLVFLFFISSQRYVAEAAFAKAVRLDRDGADIQLVVNSLDKAATTNRFNDLYWRNLSHGLLVETGREIDAIADPEQVAENRRDRIALLAEASTRAAMNATKLSPSNVLNWLVMGSVYRELIPINGNAGEIAKSAYERAVKLEPNNPLGYTELAKTRQAIAEAHAELLDAQDPAVREDAEKRVEIELAEAEMALERAIELKPDYAPAHYQLSLVYQKQGRLDDAIRKLESISEFHPLDVGALFQLGLLYLRRESDGDLALAEAKLERAVELAPAFSNARWFLSIIYERQGNFDAAIAQAERVLELNPAEGTVIERLESLRAGKIASEIPPPIEETTEGAEVSTQASQP